MPVSPGPGGEGKRGEADKKPPTVWKGAAQEEKKNPPRAVCGDRGEEMKGGNGQVLEESASPDEKTFPRLSARPGG